MADKPVTTPHQDTGAQAAQLAEAATRGATAIPAGETALATETIGDAAPAQRQAAPQPPAGEKAPPLPTVKAPFNDKRSEIAARFRTDREVLAEGDGDNITSFTRSAGLPPEFHEQVPQDPEPTADPAEAAAAEGEAAPEPVAEGAAPQFVTIKINGQSKEVPLEEALAMAQKSYAAEDMFETAKDRLKQVDTLLTDVKNRAARPAQDGTHQADPNRTQPETSEADPALAHQQDTKKLVETIQFGDPDEAEALLQHTIGVQAKQIVQQQLLDQRLADEGARSLKVLKDFEEANPEIAKDPRARAAIEVTIYEQQLEDLTQLGLDPSRIRSDGVPPTPGDIASAHRFYRAQGFGVRSPETMLETATKGFLEWRGVKTSNPADPAPVQGQKPAPRVDVSVDRQARRQAVPQQPSRTAAPRPAPQQAPAGPRDRSSIVLDMKNRNAKLRGQNLGAA